MQSVDSQCNNSYSHCLAIDLIVSEFIRCTVVVALAVVYHLDTDIPHHVIALHSVVAGRAAGRATADRASAVRGRWALAADLPLLGVGCPARPDTQWLTASQLIGVTKAGSVGLVPR